MNNANDFLLDDDELQEEEHQFMVFLIGAERYGFPILSVQEIIKKTKITRVPNCDGYIRGIINLRGKIIPVIDLRMKLGMEPRDYDSRTCFIVTRIQIGETETIVALAVDTVVRVASFPESALREVPEYGGDVPSDCILSFASDGGEPVMVLSPDRLFAGESEQIAQAAENASQ